MSIYINKQILSELFLGKINQKKATEIVAYMRNKKLITF
jgi:hypothetical protein